MASAQQLIISRKPRRSFNVVALLVMLAVVIALGGAAIWLLTRAPQASAASGGPNGNPSTLKATDVAGPDPRVLQSPLPAVTVPPIAVHSPAPTTPPQQAQPASGDGDSAARDAARERAERMRREEEARQQRLADAMRSMGGVALADPTEDDPQTQAQATAAPMEYGAPVGPVLGIGTQIPIALTQTMDSTFGGTFEVPVTADVLDERRDRVLIPAHSTCYGTTTAGGVDGQARIYGEVDLCKLPDLTRVSLDKFPLQDVDGATGLKARVDDHGAGRRNRSTAFSYVPSMVAGTLIPGIGGAVASSTVNAATQPGVVRAIPGPTLYVDASPEKPRAAYILVTHDLVFGGP